MSLATVQDHADDRCELTLSLSKGLHERILEAASAERLSVSEFIENQMRGCLKNVENDSGADARAKEVEFIPLNGAFPSREQVCLEEFAVPLSQGYIDVSGERAVYVSSVSLDRQGMRAVKRALMANRGKIIELLERTVGEFSDQDFIVLLAGPFEERESGS